MRVKTSAGFKRNYGIVPITRAERGCKAFFDLACCILVFHDYDRKAPSLSRALIGERGWAHSKTLCLVHKTFSYISISVSVDYGRARGNEYDHSVVITIMSMYQCERNNSFKRQKGESNRT